MCEDLYIFHSIVEHWRTKDIALFFGLKMDPIQWFSTSMALNNVSDNIFLLLLLTMLTSLDY